MNSTEIDALARVPTNARNRETLARLLVVVEAEIESIAACPIRAKYYGLFIRAAVLMQRADQLPKTAPGFGAASHASRLALDATRSFARRHALSPSTLSETRRAIRLVLAS